MPRAVDPSLIGKQLPIDHSPLNRIEYRVRKPDIDLQEILDQLTESWKNAVRDFIIPLIKELTGIDLTAIADLLESILGGVPQEFLQQLYAVLGDLDFSSPGAFLTSLAQAIIDLGTALLGPNSPLNALNLYNLIPTDLIAHLSASNIGTAITNFIADPDFLDGAFSGLGAWLHNATAGFGGTGAAYTVADGTTHELLSNLIPVSAGQTMPITAKARWDSLVGTGNPVQLAITGYSDVGATVQEIIASHSATPPTTDWVDLTGTYTVPDNVTSLRTRLTVSSDATAGTVYFSKVSATKIGAMLQQLIAGTDSGTLLPDDIANLFTGITTNALALLNKAGLSDFNDLVSTLEGTVAAGFETVGDRLESFLNHLSPLNGNNIASGGILDKFVPGLGTTWDSVVNNVGVIDGNGFDIGKVAEVLRGQTYAVVDSGAVINSLFARMSKLESKVSNMPVASGGSGTGTAFGGAVGVTDLDDFERTSTTSLGPLWLTSYSGGSGIWATPNGHDASFDTSGTADREFLCIRNNSAILRSATDYQRVTQVLSAKASRFYDAILGTYNYVGHNDLWLRVSDTSTTLANITAIRIRFGGDGSISIVRFLSGAPTTLKSFGPGSIIPPGPGAMLIGEAGDMNGGTTGQRYFRGIIGVSTRIEVTETGTASGFGAAFRRWGHGGRAEGHLLPLPGQEKPGIVHHWVGMDQVA